MVCDTAEPVFEEIWDNFIDSTMCSEYCPCPSTDLQEGGYDQLSDNTLYSFDRERFSDNFDYIKLMSKADQNGLGSWSDDV